ncbi:MAG: hypothetical protein K0S37_3800 [Microbacterium sp.]|nr:hypothetical protein [Microbacterium sp.]
MDTIDGTVRTAWSIEVGGLSRVDLIERLDDRGIQRNAYAEILLADPVFDEAARETTTRETTMRETVSVVEKSVADLGFTDGATLTQVFDAAVRRGLALCSAVTAPYLRLATLDQASAPDSILSTGRAPTGSVNVASPVLRADHEYPKGFYLRVIDGVPWLRGYRCDDEFVHSPGDRFVFRAPTAGRTPEFGG